MRRGRPGPACACAARLALQGGPSTSPLGLDMRLTPQTPALRRWRLWVGAAIVAEICWWVLLRPRLGSYGTVLVLTLLPLTVVGYLYRISCRPTVGFSPAPDHCNYARAQRRVLRVLAIVARQGSFRRGAALKPAA